MNRQRKEFQRIEMIRMKNEIEKLNYFCRMPVVAVLLKKKNGKVTRKLKDFATHTHTHTQL